MPTVLRLFRLAQDIFTGKATLSHRGGGGEFILGKGRSCLRIQNNELVSCTPGIHKQFGLIGLRFQQDVKLENNTEV